MSGRVKFFLISFLIIYTGLHLITLIQNPLPWFDEVFFASMSKSLLETGDFIPTVSKEMWNNEEVLFYGPIHFIVGSASFSLFGFGIFQYRWIVLLFGILTLLSTCFLLRFYIPKSKNVILLLVLLALDPFFQLSLHEGRMDFHSMFYLLSGVLLLLYGFQNQKNLYVFLSGLMISLSLLTTVRSGFIIIWLFIIAIYFFEKEYKSGSLKKLFIWVLPILVTHLVWVFWKFDSVGGYVNYFIKIFTNHSHEYIGGRFYIPRQEYPLLIVTGLSIAAGLYRKGLKYFNLTTTLALISIISFYIIILDWGPYSTFVLPFFYFLIFFGFEEISFRWKNIGFYPIMFLFMFNLSYSSLKIFQVLAERNERNPQIAYQFVKDNIPPGSKVISDGSYYYAVVQNGSEFRLYQEYLSLEEREKILREDFDYDYLIVTKMFKDKQPELEEYYLSQGEFLKVAELNIEQSELGKKIASLNLISNMEKSGYSAVIYARIKNNAPAVALRAINQK